MSVLRKTETKGSKMKTLLSMLFAVSCAVMLAGCCCGKCEKKDAEKPVCAQTECKKAAKCCCGNAQCKDCGRKCCKDAGCKDCSACCKKAAKCEKAECGKSCPTK